MKHINQTFRAAMGMAIAGIFGSAALAQQSITTFTGISYSQDFNTLATTGSNLTTPLPANWLLSENGSTTAGNYNADNGSATGNNLYSYGSTGSSERALGSLRSGTGAPNNIFGIIFVNNTGVTVTSLYIGYTGEQWRQGSQTDVDRLDFQYNSNATTLFAGTWNDFDGLDFSSPNTTSGTGALVGNNSGNFTLKGAFITGLSIPHGQSFGIRWRDSDSTSTDDGLAIDDLIVMVPEPAVPAALAGVGLFGLLAWQRRRGNRTHF